jgi:chemotaxis family two-component system response regulator Rcp1
VPNRKPAADNPVEILLVEDNAGDIRLIQEAFKEGGFASRLSIARDGEQALAFLRREKSYTECPKPVLILLDLHLPRKDGWEVLAEIKQEVGLRQIPVLVLSNSISTEDVQRAYDLNANCYIQKPADLEKLVRVGREIEAFWLGTVVLPANRKPVPPVLRASRKIA